MSRPKAFNEQQALQGAMRCFWRQGYRASSLKDLEQATGLKTSSLYHCFHSKEALFLQVLDLYIERVVRRRVTEHLYGEDALAGIENYFLGCFPSQGQQLGCLLINTGAELGGLQSAITEKVAAGLALAEKGLLQALKRAQAQNLLAPEIDTVHRAQQLSLMLSGMLVTCKLTRESDWLAESMTSVRSLLH